MVSLIRYAFILIAFFLFVGCGPIQFSNMENMDSSGRYFQLSTKTNDQLCHIFNNVYIKPQTEKQVAEILRDRGVEKCTALYTARIVPSVKPEANREAVGQSNAITVSNGNKTSTPKTSESTVIKMAKLVDGSELMYNEKTLELNESPFNCQSTGVELKVDRWDKNNKINIEQWNEFLKKFILFMPEENRDVPLRYLLTSFRFSYDNMEDIVHFHNTLFSTLKDRMDIRIEGHWKYNDVPNLSISFGYCFTIYETDYAYRLDKLHGQKIKIYADAFKWEKNIHFENVGKTYCEKAELNLLDVDFLDALEKTANAEKSVIRYYGDKHYSELELDNKTKCHLKFLVKAARDFMKTKGHSEVPLKSQI
jgi:hypothetical protein